jgi:hypothetical protein
LFSFYLFLFRQIPTCVLRHDHDHHKNQLHIHKCVGKTRFRVIVVVSNKALPFSMSVGKTRVSVIVVVCLINHCCYR